MDKKTLDISTTLVDNVAFVLFLVMEIFSEGFLGVCGLRSRGLQLLLHELQQGCARNFEKKCNYICWRMWSIHCLDLTARNQ